MKGTKMPKRTPVRKARRPTQQDTPTAPLPAAKRNRALRLVAYFLLLALALSLTLKPALRVGRLWLGQDGFEHHELSFSVDGVRAEWGFAGWMGSFSEELMRRFHLPYPEGMISAGSLAPLLDHNIQGGVLKIGGTAFPAGIGTHAPSKIAFDLGGKINRFSCLVGLDQVSPNSAGVVYSVLADGREIFRSPKLRSDADPLPIDVSVAGAKELVLFADNCEFGDMGSSVDWVDLKFNK